MGIVEVEGGVLGCMGGCLGWPRPLLPPVPPHPGPLPRRGEGNLPTTPPVSGWVAEEKTEKNQRKGERLRWLREHRIWSF